MKLSESQKKWAQDLSNVQQLISEEHGNLSSVKYDLLSDRIFVKTPKGDIKDLPVDASPLDFAYAIHTEVGNKYSGAKVNGRMVSLSYELHNNDVVEILTSPHAFPNAQWLSHAKSSLTRR
ncbi:MAG: TGS domain-containing protein [Patescibacteria group bacterium]|nr:TGS domain-containing protein [Patescibacteria group bacterium]